jgi:hypothetical protein
MDSTFQRKPEYIEAFQMSEEMQAGKSMSEAPAWVKECRQRDQRSLGSIFPTDPKDANSQNGLSLRTVYGEFHIPIGSWVVKKNEDFMIVADDHFKAAFEPVTKEANPKITTKEARQAKAAS